MRRRTKPKPQSMAEGYTLKYINYAVSDAIACFCAGNRRNARPKVLDVGCGGQPYRALLEESGFSYTGVDAVAQPGVDLLCTAEIDRDLPERLLKEAPFDFVLCTEVLEHVYDPSTAIKNMALLVAPNGLIAITTPFIYRLHEIPFDYWRATPFALERIAKQHDLVVHKSTPLGSAAETIGLLCCLYEPTEPGRLLQRYLAKPLLRTVGRALRASTINRARGASGIFVTNYMLLKKIG